MAEKMDPILCTCHKVCARCGGTFNMDLNKLYDRAWGVSGDPKTREDEQLAQRSRASLLFGEVMPEGVSKMLDSKHLDAKSATTLVDLGAGFGRLTLQAFLEFPNLTYVHAVELAKTRYEAGVRGLERLAEKDPEKYEFKNDTRREIATLTTVNKSGRGKGSKSPRVLRFSRGDLFKNTDALTADIVVCETRIPDGRLREFADLLARFQVGTRILLYHSMETIPGVEVRRSGLATSRDPEVLVYGLMSPRAVVYKQIAPNDSSLKTSWAHGGHTFDMWKNEGPEPNLNPLLPRIRMDATLNPLPMFQLQAGGSATGAFGIGVNPTFGAGVNPNFGAKFKPLPPLQLVPRVLLTKSPAGIAPMKITFPRRYRTQTRSERSQSPIRNPKTPTLKT